MIKSTIYGNLFHGHTSDAKTGAAMAAGIIEAIDFPTSIFMERAPAFTIVRAVAGTKADAEARKRKKAATILENIFFKSTVVVYASTI